MGPIDRVEILEANRRSYHDLYAAGHGFLRYPSDWVIRFHSLYLKRNVPGGRVLDYGCGSGHNSVFFLDKGYDVWGVDVTEAVKPLIERNLTARRADPGAAERFLILPPDVETLPFEDGFFDFVLSDQVLYFLASEARIRTMSRELARCLRPGGVVFFTMMGPRNYYITHRARQIHDGRVYEVGVDDPNHRLFGLRQYMYCVPDEVALRRLFAEFECVSTGYFDQSMLDMRSNFHWIFVGRRPG